MATGIRITFALFCCQVAKDLLADRSVVGHWAKGGWGGVYLWLWLEAVAVSLVSPAGTLMSCPHSQLLLHFWSTIHFHKYQLAGQVSKLTASATATATATRRRLQPATCGEQQQSSLRTAVGIWYNWTIYGLPRCSLPHLLSYSLNCHKKKVEAAPVWASKRNTGVVGVATIEATSRFNGFRVAVFNWIYASP